MTTYLIYAALLLTTSPTATLCWRWANGTPHTWTDPRVCLPVPDRVDTPAERAALWAVIRHGPIATTDAAGRRYFHAKARDRVYVEAHATPVQMAAPSTGGLKITATSPSAIPAQLRASVSKVKAP